MENIVWYAEIENQEAVVIGSGASVQWTVPYTEDSMFLKIRAGADLTDEGMTAYAEKNMLVRNRKDVDWNSLERYDFYAGRTLNFDPVIYNARGELVPAESISWSLSVNDGEPAAPAVEDGIWTIPAEPGHMRLSASFPETRDLTGTLAKEGYIIDIDNITGAYVMGIEGAAEPWYRTPASVMLYPSGCAVWIDEIRYSINGGETQAFDLSIILDEQGTYELSWYGVMPDGTEESPHSLTVAEYTEPLPVNRETKRMRYRAVDEAGNAGRWMRADWRWIKKPRTWFRIEGMTGTEGWYREIPHMMIEIIEGEAINSIEYALNGEAWKALDGSLEPGGDGYHTLSWKAQAADGSEDLVQTAVVKIDRAAPECSRNIRIENGSGTLELTAWDEHSGVLRTEYRLNGGPVMIYRGPVSLSPGDWIIEYRSLDRAGNEGEWSTTNTYVPAGGNE